ncbi:MAG TPA: tetratricopeptide repeat protein [Blastocatellia bacterium]|jgi:tetratricopeptide (TPR) repeat protein|nr:tetratricopeptide repeat protein [Blastocatellia bacterium]
MRRLAIHPFALPLAILLTTLAVCPGALAAQTASTLNRGASRAAAATSLVEEGVAALERNDAGAAKAAFQRALAVKPDDLMAHTYLGILADRAGDLPEAERHFASAVRIAPSSPASRNNYGAILLKLGRPERASAEFEASLKLDPEQASALINLAQIRFASSSPARLREARALFERARAIAPAADISRALVVIALRLGDRDGASTYYRDYAARLATPGAAATAQSRAELGRALLEAGLTAESVEELKVALEANPADVESIRLLAQAYMARREIVAAGRLLESAVARGIDSAPIYAALVEVYEMSGHIENAIPAMRLAIERDPRNEAYRFRYGMLLTDTRAPAAAVIRLEEALKEFPRSARLYFALGVAHAAEHKSDEAAKAFARSIELDPAFAPSYAYLGMAYAEQGRFSDSVALYKRAVSLDDKLAPAHYLVADGLINSTDGDLALAEKHLTRAISLDPSFALARVALAKLYFRLNRLQEAAPLLERLVIDEPDLADAHYQLGRVYMRLKRKPEADIEFAAFKRLGGTKEERARDERDKIVRRLANVRF